MAAKEVSAKEELKDIIECCICTNIFVDPRMLPCIHTFCMKCLEKTGSSLDKKSGDEMPCPVCRRQFTIPVDGFSGLQKNFFIERIIKVSNKLNLSKIDNICDSCLEENDPLQASNVPSAETYCKDCRQKLCNDCTKHHKKNKVTKTHRIVEIGNESNSEDLLEMIGQPSYCDIHSKELLKIYCSDCNAVVCSLCFVKSHRKHIGEDANEAVQEFIKCIGNNVEKLSKYMSDTVQRKEKLENAKMEMMRKIVELEKEVIKTSEEIKKRVDVEIKKRVEEDLKSLLTELGSIKSKTLKEIEVEKEDVDICRTAIESYIRYSNEMKRSGSPSDICRTFNDLNYRAKELTKMHDCLIQRQIPSSVCISFEKSQSWQQSLMINNIVGKFKVKPVLVYDDCYDVQLISATSHEGCINPGHKFEEGKTTGKVSARYVRNDEDITTVENRKSISMEREANAAEKKKLTDEDENHREMQQKYVASMLLSGVGDALGYKNAEWEFNKSGRRIHDELELLGGIKSIKINGKDWMVSDDTVMHIATAEALIGIKSNDSKENLFDILRTKYIDCMNDMSGRAPESSCISGVDYLKHNRNKYTVPFNSRAGGCGAAMRAMCIGLRYPRPEDLMNLIEVSIESGRMTHHNPTGYLGALASALFTHYAVQGKPLESWGRRLLSVLPQAKQYIVNEKVEVQKNVEAWSYFEDSWKSYLRIRGLEDGKSKPKFPPIYGVNERDKFYQDLSHSGWGGSSGHDAPMIAYDALLGSEGNWTEFCLRGVLHGGVNNSTGAIGGSWFGALYGLNDVPENHYKKLEYKERLENLGKQIYRITQTSVRTETLV